MTETQENYAENAVNQAIGTTVRKIREHLNISLEDFANETNISEEHLCNAESGIETFSNFELWNIANELQLPIQTFYSLIGFHVPKNIENFLETSKFENTLIGMFYNCKPKNMKKFIERVAEETADLRYAFE